MNVFVVLALNDIPACGRNDEVLRHHGLDVEGMIVMRINGALPGAHR